MIDFLVASLVSLTLLVSCAAIFYEVLAHVWVRLPRVEGRPRTQILFTILTLFGAHTVCVWLFGVTYFLLERYGDFGALAGNTPDGFLRYIYFSVVTYSSLGLGDVYPTGGLQLLVGVESILGLILIGWSVTFTYLVTEKYLFHRRHPEQIHHRRHSDLPK